MSEIQTVIDRLADYGRGAESFLDMLLRDHTTGGNITWADGAQMQSCQITTPPLYPIVPRYLRLREANKQRTRKRAEVFTPSWVVDKMLTSLETESKAGYMDVLNGTYLEITCGEGAFLTTRYEMETGAPIPEPRRSGVLDRKYRLLPASTRIELTPRVCPTCQKTFVPAVGANQRIYCSYTCAEIGRKKYGHYQRPTIRFNCAHCGKLVEAYGEDKRQKFCSPHCEKLYWKHPRRKEVT